jgi:hypothetical protein
MAYKPLVKNRTLEAGGSNPLCSTIIFPYQQHYKISNRVGFLSVRCDIG